MTETIERGAMALIVVTLVATLGVYFWDREYFHLVYAAEDGLVEYGTALFLLVASVVLLVRASQMRGRAGALAVGLTCFYALLFFLAAGEEISWGQRIFGWESGEFFKENNKQYETNFHNLMVGDMHLAKTLFGSVLTVVILLYLVGLPLLYPRGGWIARVADRLAVPVPKLKHGIIAIVASLIIAVIDVPRKWEVYELVFSLLVVSIFLMPLNRDKLS
ncbi:hypothetical protein K1T73_11910 [Roseovarius sp. SCSIO 43702]|uniref:hypothetical protein n=1 Tax=Roseovarius sp. SCSIO 43702 TaxID=2823043 RepID=UPI001C72C41D|nr:hypothetical protein [Roseovarius sp. SCSIO 43702]QYX55783.1 hypothetical protein K1T73_11910 [Roseovarius sp. SCSIO 43702]